MCDLPRIVLDADYNWRVAVEYASVEKAHHNLFYTPRENETLPSDPPLTAFIKLYTIIAQRFVVDELRFGCGGSAMHTLLMFNLLALFRDKLQTAPRRIAAALAAIERLRTPGETYTLVRTELWFVVDLRSIFQASRDPAHIFGTIGGIICCTATDSTYSDIDDLRRGALAALEGPAGQYYREIRLLEALNLAATTINGPIIGLLGPLPGRRYAIFHSPEHYEFVETARRNWILQEERDALLPLLTAYRSMFILSKARVSAELAEAKFRATQQTLEAELLNEPLRERKGRRTPKTTPKPAPKPPAKTKAPGATTKPGPTPEAASKRATEHSPPCPDPPLSWAVVNALERDALREIACPRLRCAVKPIGPARTRPRSPATFAAS